MLSPVVTLHLLCFLLESKSSEKMHETSPKRQCFIWISGDFNSLLQVSKSIDFLLRWPGYLKSSGV